MNIIQENAELLTEEGKLLHDIQGDDVQKHNFTCFCFVLFYSFLVIYHKFQN